MRPTFILDAVPQSSETHELPVFPLREVRYFGLSVALLQPLVEALRYDKEAFAHLHRRPHSLVLQ